MNCSTCKDKNQVEINLNTPSRKCVPTSTLTYTTESHTKYSSCEDEYFAEEQGVWFS